MESVIEILQNDSHSSRVTKLFSFPLLNRIEIIISLKQTFKIDFNTEMCLILKLERLK
jgi:hypothetical protein